ncbi:hypothetical protein H6G03_03685 [Planktothrix sp. FACHB-1375]|uniref:Uncharacterized protein n=2 Tax=Aerosakkonema funiforme TaxID=1246630 RepID=A0A926VAF7_9CYAN|nr:hypothetical protein [Aerosakkonema funiforme FACHB-1375]
MLFKEITTQKTWKVFTKVVATGAIALSSIAIGTPPSPAQNAAARGFFCDTSSGTPVTIYQNAQGTQEPWIRWVSNAFASSGYNPQTRCQEVSGRLETYRRNKQLKYITVGVMNGQRVVCTASQVNGRCENLIFTLKSNQDAVRTLNNLLAWREGQAGAPSLRESGAIPYIDVSGRLGDDGNSEMPPSVSQPSNTQPMPQQPNNNGGGSREL